MACDNGAVPALPTLAQFAGPSAVFGLKLTTIAALCMRGSSGSRKSWQSDRPTCCQIQGSHPPDLRRLDQTTA